MLASLSTAPETQGGGSREKRVIIQSPHALSRASLRTFSSQRGCVRAIPRLHTPCLLRVERISAVARVCRTPEVVVSTPPSLSLSPIYSPTAAMFMPKKTRIAIYSVRAPLGVRGYWRVQVAAWLSRARASSASAGQR
jgi:hypothetical protein